MNFDSEFKKRILENQVVTRKSSDESPSDFKKSLPENRRIRQNTRTKTSDTNKDLITRREALGRIAALTLGAGAFATGATGIAKFLESMSKSDNNEPIFQTAEEDATNMLDNEQETVVEKEVVPINEERLSQEEMRLAENMFGFYEFNGYDMEKRNLLIRLWKQKYSEHVLYKRELSVAYHSRIKPYEKELLESFSLNGTPEEYSFITIIESYAKSSAKSEKGAVGPFQFIYDTGRQYGLIERGKDNRRDLLESGEACARFLKDLHGEFDDWNLSLYAYNGGYLRRYAKDEMRRGRKPSEEGFIEHMNGRIWALRKRVKESTYRNHEVDTGETLYEIVESYSKKNQGLTPELIRAYNNIHRQNRIFPGQIIKIPLLTEEARVDYYKDEVSDIVQNLTYVPKFLGLKEAMKKSGMIKNS